MNRNHPAVFALAVSAVGLFALAAYGPGSVGPLTLPHLVAIDADRDIGPVRGSDDGFGGERVVTYRLVNRGGRPVHIVGGGRYCGTSGCMSIHHPGRVTIAPGETIHIHCTVSFPGAPGPFEASGPVYVDDGGLRTITLSARGVNVAIPEAPPPRRPQP